MTQKNPQPLSRLIPPLGVSLVIGPYGECAAEAAPRIEDTLSGKITVISMGANQLRAVIGEM